MFGWEFPPFNSGGLGVACRGLVKHISQYSDLTLILPQTPQNMQLDCDFLNINLQTKNTLTQDIEFAPYKSSKINRELSSTYKEDKVFYGKDIYQKVQIYTQQAEKFIRSEDFDVIHVHDWLTIPAGLKAKEMTDKPVVVHVHATEYDRTAGHGVNDFVYNKEREGFSQADKVLTVSNRTKEIINEKYETDEDKIEVVHNSIDQNRAVNSKDELEQLQEEHDIVLFVGRITLQKYPSGFIKAAERVSQQKDDILFLMAGSGDMKENVMELAAECGIADKVLFPGFVQGEELSKLYNSADVFIMPSVSEPFGLTALEALSHGTPTLVSKQSGVSEVVDHALRADFWDIDDMASKILSVLQYDALKEQLSDYGRREARNMSWSRPSQKCVNIYKQLV